jgi:phosphate transport system protein
MTTSERHIARAFDRDLETVQAMILKMGGLVETAILDAARALETRDEELAEAVRRNDAAIDAMEDLVNHEAARLIALRAPTAGDLRTVLSVIKIASSLERCGDYAKNLAKRSTVLAKMAPIGGSTGAIRRMARSVQVQLKDVLDAYVRRDAELAGEVRLRDKDIDQMYNALFREFLTHMMEDPSGSVTTPPASPNRSSTWSPASCPKRRARRATPRRLPMTIRNKGGRHDRG